MAFELFLKNLAEVFQLQFLSQDSHGICTITFKEAQFSLLTEADNEIVPNTVLIYCEIGDINFPEVLESCLLANATLEETLSLSSNTQKLFLHRRVHPDIQGNELKQLIDSFIAQVKVWKVKIKEQPKATTRAGLPPPQFKV